ncbi:MAG TPA: peptidyl-prolyl cis-trans isomerase [Planococcus sp. (in: firmicutes)]|nr:peptidyl-prolyl cis-trans isomerase [Planococcus sp. (in: firmicutes)]
MTSIPKNSHPAPSAAGGGPPKRRLKTKPLLILLLILFIGNLLWFIAWLVPNNGNSETVASVSGDDITREQWMVAMENEHGRETLTELVNEKVMETAAREYGIEVTDDEIDLELAMLRSGQDGSELASYSSDATRLREKVKAQLILEKVLTKDVLIEEEAARDFYDENQELYDIEDAYRTRMIVLNSVEEAKEAIGELESGSSFEALARERSVDAATRSLGGDVGYITPGQSTLDEGIVQAAASVEIDSWSHPIEMDGGRAAIVSVTEQVQRQSFSFEEVEEHISRELALEQLPQSVAPEAFWQEFDAEWFYGE